MSQPQRYEVLVLGRGEGGKYLAWPMANSGRRTAAIERKLILSGACSAGAMALSLLGGARPAARNCKKWKGWPGRRHFSNKDPVRGTKGGLPA
jgi:hypothetical protein